MRAVRLLKRSNGRVAALLILRRLFLGRGNPNSPLPSVVRTITSPRPPSAPRHSHKQGDHRARHSCGDRQTLDSGRAVRVCICHSGRPSEASSSAAPPSSCGTMNHDTVTYATELIGLDLLEDRIRNGDSVLAATHLGSSPLPAGAYPLPRRRGLNREQSRRPR